MNTSSPAKQQAIAAAKNGDWDRAVQVNAQILESNPQDTQALNRLGVAYLQLGKKTDAKKAFSKVLEIDKTNLIAKKHLKSIKSKQAPAKLSFTKQHFIEEPGRTKIVELHRLSGKQVLDTLSVGDECELTLKKRYISVECNGQYVGSIPEDVSFRLSKLIKTGNTYLCCIHSFNNATCTVYLKEMKRSRRNKDIHSFPSLKNAQSSVQDIDDRLLLEDDIPVEITNHDRDVEKTIDDVDVDSLED